MRLIARPRPATGWTAETHIPPTEGSVGRHPNCALAATPEAEPIEEGARGRDQARRVQARLGNSGGVVATSKRASRRQASAAEYEVTHRRGELRDIVIPALDDFP